MTAAASMLAAERRDHIVRALRSEGFVRSASLAQRLAVSVATVNRDLTVLARLGVARRVRGGACSTGRDVSSANTPERPTLHTVPSLTSSGADLDQPGWYDDVSRLIVSSEFAMQRGEFWKALTFALLADARSRVATHPIVAIAEHQVS